MVHEIYSTWETFVQLGEKLCGKFHKRDGCTYEHTNGRTERQKLFTPQWFLRRCDVYRQIVFFFWYFWLDIEGNNLTKFKKMGNFTKIKPGTSQLNSSMDRNFFSVLAQLDIEASITGKFHSNPLSSFCGDVITRTRKIKDGRWQPCLSTDRNYFGTCTTRHWGEQSDKV